MLMRKAQLSFEIKINKRVKICLETSSGSVTRFSSAESIVSVNNKKLPALQDFMNQWHFSISPSDVTDEMALHESRM